MHTVTTVRTPEERFTGLPDFDYQPKYHEGPGDIRVAYLDEGPGDGRPVWFMHGEPTSSFLWRTVFPPVRDAGYRCIVPDLAGFGRSDKPTDLDWYSYDSHTEVMTSLLLELDLRDATLVCHDWGGPIGLRLAIEHPDRFARIVIMDTGLFTGRQYMSDAWKAFRDFVAKTEDLPIGFLVNGAVKGELAPEVLAGYEAPFPGPEYKQGARAFPLMLPTDPTMPGAQAGQKVLDALKDDQRPTLMLWADGDPILTPETGRRFAQAIGQPEPEVIPDASHFLQEDQGPMIGARIAQWLG